MKKRILLLLIITFAFLSGLFAMSLELMGNNFYIKADSLFKQKNYEKSMEYYQKALDKYKLAKQKENAIVEDQVNEILLGKYWKACYFAKNYDKAINILKNDLNLKGLTASKQKKLELLIVTIYKKKKDIPSAINFLKERDKIKPTLWREKKIAALYFKMKDYQDALTWYLKVKDKKVTTTVVKKIATCYTKLKDYKSAVKTYEEYIQNLKKDGKASDTKLKTTYKNMATLYYNINNLEKAIVYWRKVLNIEYDKDIATNLMVAYFNLKKYDKVLKVADLMLRHNKNSADAIYYKAKIYYDKGDKRTARKYFKKLVSNPVYGKTAKEFIKSINSEIGA